MRDSSESFGYRLVYAYPEHVEYQYEEHLEFNKLKTVKQKKTPREAFNGSSRGLVIWGIHTP